MRCSTGTGSAMGCGSQLSSRCSTPCFAWWACAIAWRSSIGVPVALACELAGALVRGAPGSRRRSGTFTPPVRRRRLSGWRRSSRSACRVIVQRFRLVGELARFGVWALPTAVAWAVYGAYDARLLAPAWPPLLALVVLAALPAASAFARRGPLVLALPFALFAIVVASNVYNLDGLHKSGWDQLRRTDDWLDRDQTRAIVLPALSRALIVVRHEMRPGDSMMSPEGAFRFFYPGHVAAVVPEHSARTCSPSACSCSRPTRAASGTWRTSFTCPENRRSGPHAPRHISRSSPTGRRATRSSVSAPDAGRGPDDVVPALSG